MIAFPGCLSFPSSAAGERGKGREGKGRRETQGMQLREEKTDLSSPCVDETQGLDKVKCTIIIHPTKRSLL